jgi:hypothetical protein
MSLECLGKTTKTSSRLAGIHRAPTDRESRELPLESKLLHLFRSISQHGSSVNFSRSDVISFLGGGGGGRGLTWGKLCSNKNVVDCNSQNVSIVSIQPRNFCLLVCCLKK